jgi:glucose-1-phosphate adenylyltransferase
MPGAVVEEGATVEYAIIGENTVVRAGAHVGAPPDGTDAGAWPPAGRHVIRVGAQVPAGAMIYESEEV